MTSRMDVLAQVDDAAQSHRIAARIGRTPKSVSVDLQWLSRHGLAHYHKSRWSTSAEGRKRLASTQVPS